MLPLTATGSIQRTSDPGFRNGRRPPMLAPTRRQGHCARQFADGAKQLAACDELLQRGHVPFRLRRTRDGGGSTQHAGMRAKLPQTSPPAGAAIEIPWLEWIPIGRLFSAGSERVIRSAGHHLHRRTRPSQGRVSLQGGAVRGRSRHGPAGDRSAGIGQRRAIRDCQSAAPIWKPRLAMSWIVSRPGTILINLE